MPAYVDASALVKRYVAEVGSAWVRRLLAHPAQYVIYLPESEYPVVLAYRRQPMQRHTGIVRTIREGPQDLALTDRVGLPHDAQAFESEGEIDSTVDIIANKKRYESHRQRGFRYLPPAGGGWEGGKACMDSYPGPTGHPASRARPAPAYDRRGAMPVALPPWQTARRFPLSQAAPHRAFRAGFLLSHSATGDRD